VSSNIYEDLASISHWLNINIISCSCTHLLRDLKNAVREGSLPTLNRLLAEGCPYDAARCHSAAIESGVVPVVQWVAENLGVTFTAASIIHAVRHGRLDVCKHLHSQGCAVDTKSCGLACVNNEDYNNALEQNSCAMLQLLSQTAGANWSKKQLQEMLDECGKNDLLESAKYLRCELGALWPKQIWCSEVGWHEELKDWAVSQGYSAGFYNGIDSFYAEYGDPEHYT
jgi:hypothetical protein